MKFNFDYIKMNKNVHKLVNKSSNRKIYQVQKRVNGVTYYKRFTRLSEAVGFSNKLNKEIKQIHRVITDKYF